MAQIKISLVGDVRSFVSSFKKGKESVEDLADEVEDLAKSGDKVEREFSENFKGIAKDADKAGKKVKSGLKDGFDDAKKEAAQSGAEAAQSFGGGFEDVADFVQETLAQAFQGFGPAGAAAGIALAAALGAALQGAADAEERLAEARERAGDLATTLYENRGKLPMEDAISRVLELLPSERGAGNPIESFVNQWVDLGTNIDAVKRAAKLAGTPVRDFVRGLSGADVEATRRALEGVDDAITKVREKARGELNWENGQAIAQLEALKSQLTGVITTNDLAREALSAVGSSFDSAAYVAKVEAIGDAWSDAMVDASNYVTEAEGVTTFDWSSYLADAVATLAAANNYQRDILTVPSDIRSEAERVFSEQGAKAGAAYVAAYLSASASDRQRFVDAAKQNGAAAGKAQGESGAAAAEAAAKNKAQGWGPLPMTVQPRVDERNVKNYVAPTGTIWLEPRIRPIGGRQVI